MNSEKSENKSQIAKREEEILKFWQENKIFEKSLERNKEDFIFYDGPPFATGEPHFGHVLPTTMKDVIPRYQTMRGKRVERRWGWDCHGLPVENLIEKELGLNSKRDIEAYGIEKFNKAARDSVLRYADVWKKIMPRLGRWVDMENDYRTMDPTYTESVWWSFKTLYGNKRIYESFKVMQMCPRCGTTLSNFEVNQGYKDITDISVYAKFELIDEPGTYLLAWTTTPWTLPGNVALAVNPKLTYIRAEKEGKLYILAEDLAVKVLKEDFKIKEKFFGEKLIGKSYKPLFPYYQNKELKTADGKVAAKSRGWKIYAGDFVTTEEGTGIVHMAPAFGDEDFELAKKKGLPFVQHIDWNGKFKPEVTDFAGQYAKPKEDPQKADIEIIKYLAHHDSLFAKEKIIHSYPHCWRCDTPLLNYAASSWFVKVTEFKEKLVKENKKVNWTPKSIGENRFGKWLEGARDWAISRSRYWGAPLPVWKCQKCHKVEVLASVEDIKKHTKRNNYFLMRHGQAENNIANVLSGKVNDPRHLTEKGRKDIAVTAAELKNKNIDIIFYSPFLRTIETVDIVKDKISFKGEIIKEKRLQEFNFGDFDGRSVEEYWDFNSSTRERLTTRVPNGESLNDVRERVGEFLYEIDNKYKGKNILMITHDAPAVTIFSVAAGADEKKIINVWTRSKDFLNPGEMMELSFATLPHNENYQLDFHRPFIDEISWKCDCGGDFKRVPEVFDAWYESGSMPFAKVHYPFDRHSLAQGKPWNFLSKAKPKQFPADFIAEGLDQTRGWFYSLLVLGVELFGRSPYKNVVVNGLILAEDGRKMAKRLKNYPDLSPIIDKFSADALRYFLISSPAVRAEEVRFSEKGLDEVTKKVLNRLQNVVSFYELYKEDKGSAKGVSSSGGKSQNILDQWILARLNQLIKVMTEALDNYAFDKASRPIADFVDDLSTWYLRRSRERFKNENEDDKQAALSTTRLVLQEFSKLMAPFMPFMAEDIYQRIKGRDAKESVHLEDWPHFAKASRDEPLILKEMEEVRKIVSLGLEARAAAGIKVRQPLRELKFRTDKLDISENADYLELIKDEVNIKEAILDAAIVNEIELDTEITPELKEEGQVRELIRAVKDLRKQAGLQVGEKAAIAVSASSAGKALVEKFHQDISKAANLEEIKFTENNGEEIKIDNLVFKLKLITNH